ncbi:hypothetical protein BDN70DRAFT_346793 [Pholiota conissans]|uniref:Uncharacterized protein n=1 Tax=Pholiota conissans TaxID=109636 RepID=A0A9P5YR91_9AGAR|nr:hypothetical protein BDN70DRAFT_346793 [Pholiota conissans]
MYMLHSPYVQRTAHRPSYMRPTILASQLHTTYPTSYDTTRNNKTNSTIAFVFAPRSGGTQGHFNFTSVCDRRTAWMTILVPRNAHFVVDWCSEKWRTFVSGIVARVLGPRWIYRMAGQLERRVLGAILALGSLKEREGRKEDRCYLDFKSGHCPIASHRYAHRDTQWGAENSRCNPRR